MSNNDGTLKIVIPKEIREKLRIKAGDSLLVTYNKQNHIIYKKVVVED